ncbi:MAG TPA: hypothetical protein VGO21_01210 [Candidatus Paceibacterota bacterium]|nr:hypothetical protein [Candidatus Paceibacterota bacterium]
MRNSILRHHRKQDWKIDRWNLYWHNSFENYKKESKGNLHYSGNPLSRYHEGQAISASGYLSEGFGKNNLHSIVEVL